MSVIIALISGILFGLGLVISGMSNPSKVLNFLDLFGQFDPSLIFVIAGAVIVSFFGFRLAAGRTTSLCGTEMPAVPPARIDGQLVFGSLCFGVGWGLVGFCPGPALTSLTFGGLSAMLFVIAMLVGFIFARLVRLFL